MRNEQMVSVRRAYGLRAALSAGRQSLPMRGRQLAGVPPPLTSRSSYWK